MASAYQLDKSYFSPVDTDPGTPILPEDAPMGIPDVLLIEIPLGATIELPEVPEDVSSDSEFYQ